MNEMELAYAEALRAGGVKEDAINILIVESRNERAMLRNGECPKCAHPIRGEKDSWQGGSSNVAGVWFKYWCDVKAGGCGFLVSLKMPEVST